MSSNKLIQLQSPIVDTDISQREIDFQDMLIKERNKEIRQINQEMREVNELFVTVSDLVNQQGEIVDNIEKNITKAKIHVKESIKEIEYAKESQKRSNSLTLWIAGGITGTVAVVSAIVGAAFLL